MKRKILAMAVTAALSISSAHAAEPSLEQKLEILQQEIDQLKAQMQKLRAEAPASTGVSAYSAGAAAPAASSATTLGGYGEALYSNFRDSNVDDKADLRRFVLFFGHRFNPSLRFYSELEVEHAVSSTDDRGEVELEQAFIDYRFNDAANIKAGLFLIPLGILNETHEPPTFYGVERNLVETRIIPTTWREGGIGLHGIVGPGFNYDVGVTTGFDIGKFDDPGSGIRSAHQELSEANANDLSWYAALDYRGTPGLLVGSGVFSGDTAQNGASNTLLKGISARLTLWDVHARYSVGNLDLQGLYARGTVGDAGRATSALITASGDPSLIVPKTFDGWYALAGYHVWKHNHMDLAPFVRYERVNAQKKVPAGFAINRLDNESVTTIGLNFWVDPQVVLKADYQNFKVDDAQDRFNLGVGYMF